jgi:hypothetical protein
VALVHRQAVAVLGGAADGVDVADVDLSGIDALAEQVQAQRDQVDVAGALAVAEQAALDAVGAGQHPQLGGGHGAAAVVVGVQRQHDRLPVADRAQEPLDRVGVQVGRVHLDRGREVHDQLRSGVGSITSATASQISTAYSTSVPV